MSIWTPETRHKEVSEIFLSHYVPELIKSLNLSTDDIKASDLPNRFDVRADTLVYNYKEDPYVFDQKKGKVPEYYTVYFDGVYICGFGVDQKQAEIDVQFWKGIREAYKGNKIRFSKGLAHELNQAYEDKLMAAKKEEEARISALPETTAVQKMAKQVIRKVKNDRLQKKDK